MLVAICYHGSLSMLVAGPLHRQSLTLLVGYETGELLAFGRSRKLHLCDLESLGVRGVAGRVAWAPISEGWEVLTRQPLGLQATVVGVHAAARVRMIGGDTFVVQTPHHSSPVGRVAFALARDVAALHRACEGARLGGALAIARVGAHVESPSLTGG